MPIKISIDIGNRCQSIHTQIRLIDWSSISEINRLIEIDWYRLVSINIDYRFHRLVTSGPRHCRAQKLELALSEDLIVAYFCRPAIYDSDMRLHIRVTLHLLYWHIMRHVCSVICK